MKKLYLYFLLALFSLIILIIFAFLNYKDNKLHLVFCDVGQGDAILLTTPKQHQILIDGGPDEAVLECLARNMPFWDKSIDAIILTHPHADHFTGLIEVVDRYEVGGFYTEDVSTDSEMYHIFEAKLADHGLSAKDLQASDNFKDESGVRIKILWPSLEKIKETDQKNTDIDLNGLSVVTLVTYGKFSALLTGDAGENVMDQIAGGVGDIDILKVPHHGSRTGMSDYFLNSVDPEVAITSVGEGNRYGHPAKSSIDLLKTHNIKDLRTDLDGEIEILSDGLIYKVKSLK